ncbi:hypothetical protein K450DRAFT_235620 [Umbelopsis ramanniana AG]|uniref:Uncharacterized protein n=1 Tax=Umbelopsis ramanniana AG TaxID=1314678 RepID=A0AAD5EBL4_UMBRA|nr:uncharacterized protein K450DRAFT_235620 [Umbelopsis ramanniana AG]KAI8580718.1 hypothetical protein K450DRAFT_235620 [Umbelopsis ramanniana AG]
MLGSTQGFVAIPQPFSEPHTYDDSDYNVDLQYSLNGDSYDYKDEFNEDFAFQHAICPQAPPPSPQEPSLLDAVFAQRLSNTLKSVVEARRRSSLASVHSARLPSPASPIDCDSNSTMESTFSQHAGALNELLRKIAGSSGKVRKSPKEVHKRRNKRASKIPVASLRLHEKYTRDQTTANHMHPSVILASESACSRESKAKQQQLQRTADAASKLHMLKVLSEANDSEKSAVLEELIYELKGMGL